MWISKKKWNEMQNEINNLKIDSKSLRTRVYNLECIIENLIEAHNEIKVEKEYYDYSNLTPYNPIPELKTKMVTKYTHSSDTKTVPNVTLEELAKLVIDGTPIERKENVEMTSKFYRR